MCDDNNLKENETNKHIYLEKNANSQYSIPFWANDPNILLDPKYILEFFPTQNMSYEQKLNSISRLIILLTIIGFLYSNSMSLLIVFLITMGLIWFMHYRNHKENFDLKSTTEETPVSRVNDPKNIVKNVLELNGIDMSSNVVFDIPTQTNPFSNVLITDYEYNKSKKPALPSYYEDVNTQIMKETKDMIINNNIDQPNISNKLFREMGDQFNFEQSMHSFHTTPNTTIPNDQNGFAEFCYGNMISCKEGNMFACARNLSRYQNS